eukprot:COSAG02_NODE_57560_length_280_cov_0.602210_1_plen_23_part_01
MEPTNVLGGGWRLTACTVALGGV